MKRLTALLLSLLFALPVYGQTRIRVVDTSRAHAISNRADNLPSTVASPDVVVNVNTAGAATANTAAINAWLEKQREQTTTPYGYAVLVLPKGRIYINGTIVVPHKTGIVICGAGSGRGYLESDSAFTNASPGGPESTLVWVGGTGEPMMRLEGYGTSIFGIKFQGQLLLTETPSGTQASYGIQVDSKLATTSPAGKFPPTGKHHFSDLSFIAVGECFYFPPNPDGGDVGEGNTCSFGPMYAQNCTNFIHCKNKQGIAFALYGIQEWVSGAGPAFWFERGGGLTTQYFAMNSSGTILKIGEAGASNFEFDVDASRFDINFYTDPHAVTLIDARDHGDTTSGGDYGFSIRMRGNLGLNNGTTYTGTAADLILWPATAGTPNGFDTNLRRGIELDIAQLPPEYAANFNKRLNALAGSVTTTQRDLMPKPWVGLQIYNTTGTPKLQVCTSIAGYVAGSVPASWDSLH